MNRGLVKKAAAVIMSMALTFGAVSVLPSSVVKDNAIVASADSDYEVNGCVFHYRVAEKDGSKYIVLTNVDVKNAEGLVEIPSHITHEGVSYPVTELGISFMFGNQEARNVIMPDTITAISGNVFWDSKIEKLTISDNVEEIGYGFCVNCFDLKYQNVKYNGTKLKTVRGNVFGGAKQMYDENNAVVLNNWLIRYEPQDQPTELKIADLSHDGVKIDSIATYGVNAKTLNTVDMEGVKYVGEGTFSDHFTLNTVLNFGTDTTLDTDAFKNTPWLANDKVNNTGAIITSQTCTVFCDFTQRTGKDTLEIRQVFGYEDTVEFPSTLKVGNSKYTVTDLSEDLLRNDQTVKTVIIPSSITKISDNVLRNSSVEKISLSSGLRELGSYFAADCPELDYRNVEFEGLRLEKADCTAFENSPKMVSNSGAITLGNWLIKYKYKSGTNGIRIKFLANAGNGVIEYIADGAVNDPDDYMKSINFEDVKYIGKDNFTNWSNLQSITADQTVVKVGENCFTETPWFKAEKEKGLAKLGSVLLYYKNDSDTIDMTTEELAGIKTVNKGAFADCEKAQKLKCSSECTLEEGCFYADNDGNNTDPKDPLPVKSVYKIKNITLDGEELAFSKDKPVMPDWVNDNFAALEGSEWVKVNAEAKMKAVFEQLNMSYYGLANNKIGTLKPTQEFYNMLKAHEYISTYEADSSNKYNGVINAFLCGGKLDSKEYSQLIHFMLECSGVEYNSLVSDTHEWNSTKIGDEWFEGDAGLDAQNGHGYGWFALSSSKISALDTANDSQEHSYKYASSTWHEYNKVNERPEAKRILGDVNGDNVRDKKDVTALWDHLNGKGSVDKKAGDINFDGVVDVKDGVLLDAFVNHTSVDPKKYSKDGLAPGFNVAFVDGNSYSSIKYDFTDRDGYIVLPDKPMFDTPKGKVFDGWNIGKAGAKVKITEPYTVISPKWKSTGLLGDVDGNGIIDISDVSKLINHINGVKALNDEELLRADVNKSKTVDISDASTIINHINGVKALEGTV